MHMKEDKLLNMSYYLLKSLTKMVEAIRKRRILETTLYHIGFIMMLINAELE
jgi:hypothetical protein